MHGSRDATGVATWMPWRIRSLMIARESVGTADYDETECQTRLLKLGLTPPPISPSKNRGTSNRLLCNRTYTNTKDRLSGMSNQAVVNQFYKNLIPGDK